MSYTSTPEGWAKRVLGDARYAERHRFPKWNTRPTVLDEPRLFPRVFPELTKADHVRLAGVFRARARKIDEAHHRHIARGEKAYGAHGSLISGGFREHWAESSKEVARRLARASTLLHAAVHAHETAAKRRSTQRDPYAEGYKAAALTARFRRASKRRLMRPFVQRWVVTKDGVVQKSSGTYATKEKAEEMAEWHRPDPKGNYWTRGRQHGPEYDVRQIKVYQ